MLTHTVHGQEQDIVCRLCASLVAQRVKNIPERQET